MFSHDTHIQSKGIIKHCSLHESLGFACKDQRNIVRHNCNTKRGLNLPTRVRVILAYAPPEEALAAVAARRSVVLAGGSVAANRANVAAAIAVRHPDHLQVFNVVHHRG